MISKNFIKSSAIYTLAGALPMASAVILLPFYFWFLPTAVYGALSLYLAFALFVQILVVYSFDTSLYVHYHEYKNDPAKLASFISSAFIFMILVAAMVGLGMTVIGEWVFSLVFAKGKKISFYPFGIMSVVVGACQAFFKVYANVMQSREKPLLFLKSNLFLFSLIALFTIAGLYIFPGSLLGPIGGRLLAGLIVTIWVFYKIISEFGFHFNYPLLRSTFGYNHYAFIYQIQQWIINYFDRFLMILAALSLSSVGIYDFAIKCLVVIEVIMSGLHNSFYPKVVSTITAQSVKQSTPELNRYYHGLIAVIMILIVASILVLPPALQILQVKNEYIEAVQYFPFIAILYIPRTMRLYFAVPYGILKYTKPLPIIYTIIIAVKIGLMILLIKQYEIYGLIAASLVSILLEIIILKYWLKGKFHFQFNAFKIVVAPVMLLITILVLELYLGSWLTWKLHLFYVVLTGILLAWVYRNELRTIDLSKIIKR